MFCGARDRAQFGNERVTPLISHPCVTLREVLIARQGVQGTFLAADPQRRRHECMIGAFQTRINQSINSSSRSASYSKRLMTNSMSSGPIDAASADARRRAHPAATPSDGGTTAANARPGRPPPRRRRRRARATPRQHVVLIERIAHGLPGCADDTRVGSGLERAASDSSSADAALAEVDYCLMEIGVTLAVSQYVIPFSGLPRTRPCSPRGVPVRVRSTVGRGGGPSVAPDARSRSARR